VKTKGKFISAPKQLNLECMLKMATRIKQYPLTSNSWQQTNQE